MPIYQSITVNLGVTPFVINAELPSGASRPDFVISEIGLPQFSMRLNYAPDADDVPGKVFQSAALDVGTLPLVIKVHGATMSQLQDNRRALEVMFSQMPGYLLTLHLDGEDEAYNAFPTWPAWTIDIPQRIATATLSVPVNPLGA